MKTIRLLYFVLPALFAASAFGQPFGPDVVPAKTSGLATFDLDFPGGTPDALISAVEAAQGHPVNAVIPAEEAQAQLPPLKVKHVNVRQLFGALFLANVRQRKVPGGEAYTNYSFGFKTENTGEVTMDSVWYFRDERTSFPPICRFFLLTPYLAKGQSVDDITTSLQTGWKMLGDANPPKLSFHKETNLLIAVGDPAQLSLIDSALRELNPAAAHAVSSPEK
jgi:hypothetical protein